MQHYEGRSIDTNNAASTREPNPVRPRLPEEYGVPCTEDGMVAWDWVVERLGRARNYWVCTASPNGRPHAVPVWAAWLDGTLYFDGHPQTRWGRNLQSNPAISVHLESGDEVVILEGGVEDIAQLDRDRADRLAQLFAGKYEQAPNPDDWVARGLFALRPRLVLAWSEFPKTLTKWRFD